MQIHIWLRRHLDWDDEEAVDAGLDPELRAPVELWNSTFTMPYHRFRSRLREIAAQSLDATGLPQTPWEDIPDDALVLPVDDDDWFASDIAERLRTEVRGDSGGAYWTSSWLQRPTSIRHTIYLVQRRLIPSTPHYLVTTNNYALVKRTVPQKIFIDHVRADSWLKGEPGARSVQFLRERLSLANRTLASLTSLTLNMRRKEAVSSRATLVWKYLRYRRYYRRRPAPGLEWSAPYMAQMDALMGEIALR